MIPSKPFTASEGLTFLPTLQGPHLLNRKRKPARTALREFRSASSLIDASATSSIRRRCRAFFSRQHIQYDQPVAFGRELIVEIGDGLPNVPIHLLKIECPMKRTVESAWSEEFLSGGSRMKSASSWNSQSRLKFGLGAG